MKRWSRYGGMPGPGVSQGAWGTSSLVMVFLRAYPELSLITEDSERTSDQTQRVHPL